MHDRTVGLPPSGDECQAAVGRALWLRVEEYRTAIPPLHLTDSAIQERLTGLPLPGTKQCHNGWWLVGTIVDQIADKELDVWFRFGPPSALATSERKRPTYVEPKPPAVVPDGIQALYRSRWEQERNRS